MPPWVNFRGPVHGQTQGFKNSLEVMVHVASGENVHVQIHAEVLRQRIQKVVPVFHRVIFARCFAFYIRKLRPSSFHLVPILAGKAIRIIRCR